MPISQIVTNSIANEAVVTADLANSAVTTVKIADSAVTNAKVDTVAATKLTGTIAAARLPTGSVLQVASATTNSSFSTSATSFTDITGMSVTITPSSSTSKILVMGHMQVGGSDDSRYSAFRLTRNNTSLVEGDKGGNNGTNAFVSCGGQNGNQRPYTNESMAFNYLDSPSSTSALTYRMQVNPNAAFTGRIFYLNRPQNTDDNLRIWTVSTITVMEIAG
jgi:hypothetical protein